MNKYLAEFFGSFIFIFVILKIGQTLPILLTITAIVLIFENISGAHFNPLVSMIMYLNKTLSQSDLMAYIISQLAGGILAYELVNSKI